MSVFTDRKRRAGIFDDAGVSVLVVLGVALLATLAVQLLDLPLDTAILGLSG